jgi:hypothetical protein
VVEIMALERGLMVKECFMTLFIKPESCSLLDIGIQGDAASAFAGVCCRCMFEEKGCAYGLCIHKGTR